MWIYNISLYLSNIWSDKNQPKPIQITHWCSAEISTFNHMHVIDHTDLDKLFKVTQSVSKCERSCDSFVHVSCVEIVLINVTENHSSAVLWAGIIIQLVRSYNICFYPLGSSQNDKVRKSRGSSFIPLVWWLVLLFGFWEYPSQFSVLLCFSAINVFPVFICFGFFSVAY